MITRTHAKRAFFVVGTAGFLSAALHAVKPTLHAARPAQAQAAQTETPNAPTQTGQTFPASPDAPVPFSATPTQSDALSEYNGYNGYNTTKMPPVSRIRQDKAGNSDSTAAVNYLTSVSPFSGNAPAALWLGTQYGVKHLLPGKTVRYYLRESGLSGDYVEAINGNDDEAFALVRVPNKEPNNGNYNKPASPRLAFCVWDKNADTWKAATEINTLLPDRFGFRYDPARSKDLREIENWQGRSVLAESTNFVAFASGVVAGDEDALAYLWDKKNQAVRPIVWEPELKKAGASVVGVSFLFVDEAHQTLWIGTSQGLLAYDFAKQTWRTFLTGQVVSAGAAVPAQNVLWVTSRTPVPPAPRPQPNVPSPSSSGNVPPLWRLQRVDLVSGETAEMPLPPAAPEGGFYRYYAVPADSDPDGLIVEKNQIWTTVTAPSPYGRGFRSNEASIKRFDTTIKTWEHFETSPPPPRMPPGKTQPKPPDVPASDPAAIFARLDTVPDAALVPYTLSANINQGDGRYYGYNGPTPAPPAYWISHRFPSWYGQADTEAEAALKAPTRRGQNPKNGWSAQSDTLVYIAPPEAGGTGATAPKPQRFPLKATLSGFQPDVQQMVSAGPQNPGLLIVQTATSPFLVNTQTGTWQQIRRVTNSTDFMASGSNRLLSGPSGSVLFQSGWSNQSPQTWNASARTFVDAHLAAPKNSQIFGPGINGATWFVAYDGKNTPLYLPAPSTKKPNPTAETVEPPAPTTWAAERFDSGTYRPRPFAAWGSTLWYKVSVPGSYFGITNSSGRPSTSTRTSLAGYDISTETWTLPLPLFGDNYGEFIPLLHTKDATYAADVAGNPNGSVWKWSASAKKWEVVAPPLPLEQGFFERGTDPLLRPVFPVSVDDKNLWVLVWGRMMARYNFQSRNWQTLDLPPALRQKPASYSPYGRENSMKAVQIGPMDFGVGSKAGLWRLHISDAGGKLSGTWKTVERQITVASQPAGANGSRPQIPPDFRLSSVVETPRYVWAIGSQQQAFSFPARFDKTAKTWTTWDAKSGFPTQESNFYEVSPEDDTLWVSGRSGTYRYDPITKHWQRIVQDRNDTSSPKPTVVFKPKGPTFDGSVYRLTEDANAVYLMFRTSTSTNEETNPNEKTILLRWDKAAQTTAALPFPAALLKESSYVAANTLLSDANTVWVGSDQGIFAWDKVRKIWSHAAYPATFPAYQTNSLVRSGNALVLTGYAAYNGSREGATHVIRLVSPPFAKMQGNQRGNQR